jgi:ATPase subunit of ABC transporter with duplicated ATPase domains
MLTLQGVSYTHPDREVLFSDLNISINNNDKIALIGNNGAGKSTLLKIIAGSLPAASGIVRANEKPYYIPQHLGQYNYQTIAETLHVADKLKALSEILEGKVTEDNLTLLNDDWTIEERCREALVKWGLNANDLEKKMERLSGGEKTKVFLAGIHIHQPETVLLDEPSNHLDLKSRSLLYDYVGSAKNTLIVVSHDRTLLNLLNTTYELGRSGIKVYGGNYDFYAEQKKLENEALSQDIKSKQQALRKAKETERESMERQQKLDARGKKKQEKAGAPRIALNTLRNNAEKSTSRVKEVHGEKINEIAGELSKLRESIPDADKMRLNLDSSKLHKGKVIINAEAINFKYSEDFIWKNSLTFKIVSGHRVVIKGANGSGKTTLIKIILRLLQPQAGSIQRQAIKSIYIDQDYSLIDNSLTVYEQAQKFNTGALQEHDIKMRLNRFLFNSTYWDKACSSLSGGEKMRLMLCSLTIGNQSPELIVMDEPTNNLDIQNLEILTNAINEYEGTLIVVSHDDYFLKQINIEDEIILD